jgi:hypothetical protein
MQPGSGARRGGGNGGDGQCMLARGGRRGLNRGLGRGEAVHASHIIGMGVVWTRRWGDVRLYGNDVVGRAAEVGAARPVGAWCVAQVRGSASVTHRSQGTTQGPRVTYVPRRARTAT